MDDSSDRAARLEALTLALVHRFNNVLMGIQPHVEVIKRASKENERALGSATQIETVLKRAKTVMNDVTRLVRKIELHPAALSVDKWFDTLREDMRPFSTSPVDLTFDSGHDLVVSGDRDELTRVIASLVANAVEAMPNGGKITVTSREAANGVEIAVADSGSGISPDMLARVFDPMYTTKRSAAGLGLSIAQQIVEAHGGTLRIDSTVGVGTTVKFVLARA